MRKLVIAAILTATLVFSAGCASVSRFGKSVESEMANGISRSIVLYSNTGEEIQRWKGRYDLRVSEEGGHILFDKDGKRTVITGGIVVSEED